MNEPSVFSGPEITMPKDALHLQGTVEHRDVHNLYGQYMQRATYEGLKKREPNERPFVLSRAAYSGSQKWGALWTGDNVASWSHLAITTPMLLSLSLAGLPFVGADVGGFFGNPEPELLVRWYQTGALQPFFRAHAHIETKRREPWLFAEPFLSHIRDAIRLRYQLLPYIYTLFYEASLTGVPPMRPMWMEHGGLEAVDDQFMLGSALLHKPVTAKDETSVSVAFPAERLWYDFFTLQPVEQDAFGSRTAVPVDLDTVPLFIGGGSILPLKLRQRRSSRAMLADPFTLLVAPDAKKRANGTVYVDDGVSHDHELGAQHFMRISFDGTTLACQPYDSYSAIGPKHLPKHISSAIEAIIICGLERIPSGAHVQAGSVKKPVTIESEGSGIIRLRMPPVSLSTSWSIVLE